MMRCMENAKSDQRRFKLSMLGLILVLPMIVCIGWWLHRTRLDSEQVNFGGVKPRIIIQDEEPPLTLPDTPQGSRNAHSPTH
jgi:hypothetical protein